MAFCVYVLKSGRDGIRYVGSGADARTRLLRHNLGDYRFTKGHRPWMLIYEEQYETRSEAVKRELFLKSGQGRRFLDSILGS
ncbi:TPA: endonuclease [Patescibacteria group bacterium]|nr:MAG: GIY-YIG domain protein [Parcubacteria group bacterium GW2011_GWA2_46_39]HBV33690.1 endonuclease [Patescibacteria group bacterium]HCU48012.1 endonuclease [Patescibacteria group bacterium]